MATIVDNTPVRVLGMADPAEGLDMYREANFFFAKIKVNEIHVSYQQYHQSPTGSRMNEVEMCYIVKDIQVIEAIAEVLDEVGNILIPAQAEVPESLAFTGWAKMLIANEHVGAELGNDIIMAAIKNVLSTLPFDVVNNYELRVAA